MDEKESVEKAVKRGSRTGFRRKRYKYDEKLRAVIFSSVERRDSGLRCMGPGPASIAIGCGSI
jgi:hypothetical protein